MRIAPEITAQTDDISNGESAAVRAHLPVDATGYVTFSLFKGDEYITNKTSEIINGTAACAFDNLAIANYIVKMAYSADAKYDPSAAEARFTVSPKVDILQNVSIGKDGRISMDLVNDSGGIIIMIDGLYVSGETITNNRIDYTVSTENMTARNHTVTFGYYGTKYDENVLRHWNGEKYVAREYLMYIAPKEIEVPDNAETDDGILVLEVGENATGTIDVYVDGVKVQVVTISKGIAVIDLSEYKNETHTFTFEYSGDEIYEGFSKNITVRHKTASIAASNMKVLYSSGKTYSIRVYEDEGVPAKNTEVKVLLNGKAFQTLRTNGDGVASFKVKNAPGKYTLTIQSISKTATAKLSVSHVVKLKKVKVKRSAKKLVLTATLKKVNGKVLKKAQVTFSFNGKKYTVKTNKKGVAKVTVKSDVFKNLKPGKKVTYEATYKKDTVRKTAKVGK